MCAGKTAPPYMRNIVSIKQSESGQEKYSNLGGAETIVPDMGRTSHMLSSIRSDREEKTWIEDITRWVISQAWWHFGYQCLIEVWYSHSNGRESCPIFQKIKEPFTRIQRWVEVLFECHRRTGRLEMIIPTHIPAPVWTISQTWTRRPDLASIASISIRTITLTMSINSFR